MASIFFDFTTAAPGDTISMVVSGLTPGKTYFGICQPNEGWSSADQGQSFVAPAGGTYQKYFVIPTTAPEGLYIVHIYDADTGAEVANAGFTVSNAGKIVTLGMTITPTTVHQLDSVVITSSGWQPNSTVSLFVDDTFHGIGANQNGSVFVEFIIDSTISVGNHNFYLDGFADTGAQAQTDIVVVTVLEAGTTLDPHFRFDPTQISPFGHVSAILEGWLPGETVRLTTDKPKTQGVNPPPINVDGTTGNATTLLEVGLYFADGLNTVTAHGVSSNLERTTQLSVGLLPPPPGSPVNITVDKPLLAYLGRPMTVSGILVYSDIDPSTAGKPVRLSDYDINVKIRKDPDIPGVPDVYNKAFVPTTYDTASTGAYDGDIQIPEASSPLDQLGYDATLTVTIFQKGSTTKLMDASQKFHMNPRPVKFHIDDGGSTPSIIHGDVNEPYKMFVIFSSGTDLTGNPAYGYAMLQSPDPADSSKWVDITDTLRITDTQQTGLGLPIKYEWPFTIQTKLNLGDRINYRAVVGSWDKEKNLPISVDASRVIFVQAGNPGLVQWLSQNGKWILIAAVGVAGAGVAVKAISAHQGKQPIEIFTGPIRSAANRVRRKK